MSWKSIAVVALGTLSTAMAQQPARISQPEVRLELADGQTQFKLGDVIRLELVFRDTTFPDVRAAVPLNSAWVPAPGQPTVNDTQYPDLADDVTITPARGWFQWHGTSAHDYMMDTPLDATGVRVPLVLNQGYVFRAPGHYHITVTTSRIAFKPITTNSVDIDIAARSADEEAALTNTLDATIAATNGAQRTKAVEQLAYLTGDDATRAKVKWLLGPDQNIATAMSDGLAATKNQPLQLELLRAAWLDPQRAPDINLQGALREAEWFQRGRMLAGWRFSYLIAKYDPELRALGAEYQQDLARLIATLPQRTGDVRRDTAYYLVQNNELSAEELARVKPVLLEEFPRMDPCPQSMLIDNRWLAVKDPSLAPTLKLMIESKAEYMDAAGALQRLVEIDEAESRPYVVEMICRHRSSLTLDKLTGVTADRLPEVNACLTALLNKGEHREQDFEWEQAAQRAARFATPAILPAIETAWTSRWQDASMLALLIRDAPKEAVALLNRAPVIDWSPTNNVYDALGGKFPTEVLAWLRKSDTTIADYELAQHGEPQDRAMLEQRLEALRTLWLGREAEMKDAQPNTPAYVAKNEEQDLVSSLLTAKAWTLTEEEKQRLTNPCLSEPCQQYTPQRNPSPTTLPTPLTSS